MLCLDYATPVLLQQLLRSMEDPHTLRTSAIVYAVLRLVVRLIAAQSYALGLWFSRRSYERSRGEMITMLYEKTLSRKIIGNQAHDKEFSQEDVADYLQKPIKSKFHPQILWRKPLIWMNGSSHAKSQIQKQPASMGKILNLMRYGRSSIVVASI